MSMRTVLWGAGTALLLFGLAACEQETAVSEPVPQPTAAAPSVKPAPATAKPAARAVEAERAVRSFVDALFAGYEDDGALADFFGDPAATFEPEMAQRMATLYAQSADSGMYHDAFEADPVCACQDFGKFSHTIRTVDVSGDRAKVTLSTANFGETQIRTLQLVETPAGWRIYDIDGRYRAVVFGD